MPTVELLLDAHAIIAESLLWEVESGMLYWCDIKAPALYRLDPRTLKNERWSLPEDIGAFALTGDDNGAVVALRSGLFALSFATGALERVATAPWDPERFRFNEGACDAAGRFWVGTMCDPPPGGDDQGTAPLHVWTSATGLMSCGRSARCHNGMAWSPDGRTFYLSHSMQKEVFAYDFDVVTGQLGPQLSFAVLHGIGIPDGAAVDEEGAYWCAHHGASELRRYTPDGTLLQQIPLPVSRPTMCAFGGPDLRTLYISSASDKLSPSQRWHEPHAGALFWMDPGVRGIPRTVRAV